MSIESVMPSNHLILFCPLFFHPSIFPRSGSFPVKLALCITWPKYWSFCISPSNEYSELISCRTDWFDLLAVHGNLNSLQHHRRSKESILWLSTFFMVQLSYPYMSTGKTLALTRWTFVGKVMSLLLNMLSIFSSKEQASFNFMAAVIICRDSGDPKNKVSHCFHCFSIYLPQSDGTGCHDVSFLNVRF